MSEGGEEGTQGGKARAVLIRAGSCRPVLSKVGSKSRRERTFRRDIAISKAGGRGAWTYAHGAVYLGAECMALCVWRSMSLFETAWSWHTGRPKRMATVV